MSMLKKRDVNFCPLCGEFVYADKEGPYVVCSHCSFAFAVVKKPELIIATREGNTFLKECGEGKGKNGGKIKFDSVAAAFARSLTLDDIPHRSRHLMEFYLCRWCEKFHMGHGGKHKKNVTTSYTYQQAKEMYDQAVENAGILTA